MAKKIPTSVFARGTKLMGLASRIAMEEIGSRVKTWENEKTKLQSKIQMAQNVVETLSHLKGASMKLGQLISMDMGDYFPPEIIKVLEQLQAQASFLPYKKIEVTLKHELGARFSRLKNISESPIAAASIGQVHKAMLDNKEVVLKVQYPGVAESIPSDLKLLRLIVKQLSFFQGKDLDLKPFFDEVEDVLKKESDYLYELKMHQLYREKFLDSDFIIPEVYTNFTTSKVITQEFISGITPNQWLSQNPPFEMKQKIAGQLMKLYLDEFFIHGIVQTDPNPGNFLITHDHKIALLDFGAVKEYSREFIESYRTVLKAAYHQDKKLLLSESIRLKFIDARESEVAKELFLEMLEILAQPFRQKEAFDFADKTFFTRSRDLTWEINRQCKFSPPPRDLLFLHRKLVGVFIFIKKLDVKVRLNDYWTQIENP